MHQLTKLISFVSGVHESLLVNLERLSNLKSLLMVIHQGFVEYLWYFKKLNMPQLESLSLWNFHELDAFWKKKHYGFENIKEVCYGPCMDINVLDDLMMHFPKNESIMVEMGWNATGNVWDRLFL
jgi:hypothetical protein